MRRILIGGTHSGCGKTTVTLAVLSALKRRGLKLAVLSNKPHAETIRVVETLFGKGTFDVLQGQEPGP